MKADQRFCIDGIHIRDRDGRAVLFRGCNLGGDSKIPASPPGNPLDSRVSFVGRPFPLEQADTHFARLAGWGFNIIRFIVTWEAVEHEGPGVYDEDYLAYLREILKKAEQYGLSVIIDPHQDVWSRWTGGDGAPRWTLEAVGIDPDRIDATGAAITQHGRRDAYQPMSWGLNNLRYGAATMYTLFFAGNTFAPGLHIEGIPAQDWLQDHYIDAMNHTARRIKDCDAVIGFGIFNEPHSGFIGLDDLQGHARITAPSGAAPSAFDAIVSASGFPRKVGRFSLFGKMPAPGSEVFNPAGSTLFRTGHDCPWKTAGVWEIRDGSPHVLKPDYFSKFPVHTGNGGVPVSFSEHFLKPFQKRFMQSLMKKHKHYLFFAEGVPMGERPAWNRDDRETPGGKQLPVVEAFHWYEGMTLLSKKWRRWICANAITGRPVFGSAAVEKSIRSQLAQLAALPRSEGIPAFLGEFGIPFDLENGASFSSGEYGKQEEALGLFYDAVDRLLLHATIWNYSASNTHDGGDSWNTEDISVYSSTTGEGRAIRGFSRPYAPTVSGTLQEMRFDTKTGVFELAWDAVPGETEIFIPECWYPEGWSLIEISSGVRVCETDNTRLIVLECVDPGSVRIRIRPRV